MTLTQMRHAKLWFAGQAANWSLAAYELDELNEGMQDAATFRAFLRSKHLRDLKRDYDRWFGRVSERARFAYVQVSP